MTSAAHDCRPDDHPDDWQGSGWAGTSYDCPVCGSHWYLDLSYDGPGYRGEQHHTWTRDE